MTRTLAWLLVFVCLALPRGVVATPYRIVEQWTAADGLPAESIAGLAIDDKNQLWLATYDGVVRYQGFDFQHYNRASEPALPSNRLAAIYAAPTSGVILHFENGQLGHLNEQAYETISQTRIARIAVFGSKIWFIRAETGQLWSWNQAEGLRELEDLREVTAMTIDPFAKRLLVGTADGRVLARSAEHEQPSELLHRLAAAVIGLTAGPDGEILAMDKQGAYLVRGASITENPNKLATWDRPQQGSLRGTWTERGWLVANLFTDRGTGPHLVGSSSVLPLDVVELTSVDADRSPSVVNYIDQQSRRWVNDGLLLFRDGELMFRGSERIVDFVVDPFEQVWIAQPKQGLRLLRRDMIETLGDQPGELSDTNLNLVTELNGDILVGSWVELSKLDPNTGQWTQLLRRGVRDVLPDGDDLLVAINGLCRLEAPGRCVSIATYPGGRAEVRLLHRDATGAVWAGTTAGLYRRATNGSWQPQAVHPATVRVALENETGRLVFGTNGNGLLVTSVHAPESEPMMTSIGPEQGLSSEFVRSLLAVPEGTLVGTEDAGLCLLDPELNVVRCLSTAAGLPHHSAHYMVVDQQERMWVNTNDGIYRVELAELLGFLKGQSDQIPSFARFGERQGMPSVEGNGGVYRAGAQTADGRIWFPNQMGLVAIRPDRDLLIPYLPLTPEIRILDATIDGPLHLARNARHLNLELVATALAEPQNVQFRYRIDSDTEWQELGQQRRLTFRDLQPGRHRLEVEAGYVDTDWIGTPAALEFTAGYRLHEHPAFRGLLLLLLVIAAGGLWLLVRRRQQTLEQAVADRSSQLDQATERLAQLSGSLQQIDLQHRTALRAVGHELKAALNAALAPLLQQQGKPTPLAAAEKVRSQARTLDALIDQIDSFGEADQVPRASSASHEPANGESNTAPDLETQIRLEVLLHLGDPEFSVEQLAERLGMSRSVLYRRVAEFQAASPAELIRDLRLEQASQLLLESDERISTIGHSTGFRDVSTFSRAFSKKMGVSPRQWRQQRAQKSQTVKS